ncbi:MAG: hypothetical protein ACLF0G_00090 [Candidatus Brocadiia bacterium]
MAIRKRMCVHHPDRPAIGVCVITRKPICAECSTRYEGVNYSKEGLRILQERRAAAARARGSTGRLAAGLAVALSPIFFILLYLFFLVGFRALIDIAQLGR